MPYDDMKSEKMEEMEASEEMADSVMESEEEVDEMAEGPGDPVEALGQAISEHGADDPAKLVEWLQEYGFDLVPSGNASVTIGVGIGAPEEEDDLPPMPESPFDLAGSRKAAAARAMRGQ